MTTTQPTAITVSRKLEAMRDAIRAGGDHGVTTADAEALLNPLTVAQVRQVNRLLGRTAEVARDKATLVQEVARNAVGAMLAARVLRAP